MKIFIYQVIIISLVSLAACTGNHESKRHRNVRELFEESVRIGMNYCDSIKLAKDSSEVLHLSKAFEDALTKVNYNYPPDTDLEISEGENDTLINISRRFVHLRDSVLDNFHLAKTAIEFEPEYIDSGGNSEGADKFGPSLP